MSNAKQTSAPTPEPRLYSRWRTRRPTLVAMCFLTAMWILLWGELTWGNVIGGVLVALFVTVIAPVPNLNIGGLRIRPWPVLKLAATFIIDFTRSSVQVAWLAIRRATPPPGAIVHVPMDVREDLTLALAITLLNLQPGGIVVEINKTRKELTMHLIDGSSTGAIAAALRQFERMRLQLIDALESEPTPARDTEAPGGGRKGDSDD